MLARLLDGLIHPLIHVGYGYEFGVPGMIVEGLRRCVLPENCSLKKQKTKGLSQAAVHGATSTPVIPSSLWKEFPNDTPKSTSNLLTILARTIADNEIAPTQNDQAVYSQIVQTYSPQILKQVNSWKIDISTKEGLKRVLEEIAWFVSLIYAVPGYTNTNHEGIFSADFF
jgi:hypothetical protein